MALRENPTTLVPGLFDRAVHGNITQLQVFMNEFIAKILSESNCNASLSWVMPLKEAVAESTRYFIIQRNGIAVSYGAVSSRETIDDMMDEVARRFNKEVLVPQSRDGGFISVTAKTDRSLKVEFAVVRLAEEGSPQVEPALVDAQNSTVELGDNDVVDAEKTFRAFIDYCIQFLPITTD